MVALQRETPLGLITSEDHGVEGIAAMELRRETQHHMV
jgi:hypothetical protein